MGIRLVFVLGIVNIVAMLLAFFSCRCLVGARFIQKMQKYNWYRWFYRHHCYYWWLFFASVLLHSAIAVLLFGRQF